MASRCLCGDPTTPGKLSTRCKACLRETLEEGQTGVATTWRGP